jgi:hypothetical protein
MCPHHHHLSSLSIQNPDAPELVLSLVFLFDAQEVAICGSVASEALPAGHALSFFGCLYCY